MLLRRDFVKGLCHFWRREVAAHARLCHEPKDLLSLTLKLHGNESGIRESLTRELEQVTRKISHLKSRNLSSSSVNNTCNMLAPPAPPAILLHSGSLDSDEPSVPGKKGKTILFEKLRAFDKTYNKAGRL